MSQINCKQQTNKKQFEIIDLSLPIEEGVLEPFPVTIKRIGHCEGISCLSRNIVFSKHKSMLQNLRSIFKYISGERRFSKNDFPDGEFISEEKVTASVHTGTHLDAPYHFGSKCGGEVSKTIDQIPLEWCFSDGVVLDMTEKKPGESILTQDLERALLKIDYIIKPFDIVLIKTGADKFWGKKEYFFMFPGMSEEATAYLLEKGIKIIGIDSMGFDRPFENMISDFFKTKDNKNLWPSHIYGREKEYCHIERLANLDKISKPYGFKIVCLPIKVKNVGAAWTRAIAII